MFTGMLLEMTCALPRSSGKLGHVEQSIQLKVTMVEVCDNVPYYCCTDK